MKIDETDPDARIVGPLHATLAGVAVTGENFNGAGELEIQTNGGAFTAALGTILELGSGWYAYQATAPDAAALGDIAIKIEGVCDPFTLLEGVEEAPQGIPVDTTDADLLNIGPIPIVGPTGTPLTTLVGITVEVSINGAAWDATPAGALSYLEPGFAQYEADPTEATAIGWIAIRLTGTCQEVVFREFVVGPGGVAPAIAIVSPDPDVAPGDPGGFDSDLATAQQTPIVIELDPDPDYACVVARYPGETIERVIYRRGSFRRGFTVHSWDELDGTVRRLHILPDGGWPESGDEDDVVIDVDGVGGGALSDIAGSS